MIKQAAASPSSGEGKLQGSRYGQTAHSPDKAGEYCTELFSQLESNSRRKTPRLLDGNGITNGGGEGNSSEFPERRVPIRVPVYAAYVAAFFGVWNRIRVPGQADAAEWAIMAVTTNSNGLFSFWKLEEKCVIFGGAELESPNWCVV